MQGDKFWNNGSDTTFQTGIWLLETVDDDTINKGYFITQFIRSSEIRSLWDNIWVRIRPFLYSSSKIIVKARGVDRRPLAYSVSAIYTLSATVTWTSTTTFTLTLSATDDALAEGNEVEILNGVNAGQLAHITTISGAHGALQTITIDETMTTNSSTSTVYFANWKKLGTFDANNTTLSTENFNIGISSPYIQFKVELRGIATDIKIEDLIVNDSILTYNKK